MICEHPDGCPHTAVEFFEYNDEEGINVCWKHYGQLLDELEQRTPRPIPTDHLGRPMVWDADTLCWTEVRG